MERKVDRYAGAEVRVRQRTNMAGPTITARLYSLLFRRTSTFALTIAVGALFFERAFDQGADAIYENINQGEQESRISLNYFGPFFFHYVPLRLPDERSRFTTFNGSPLSARSNPKSLS
ncbi:Cytochrome b-c1 complex subunit 9 [Galemys pyrenaicus]|uniref:Cytochrome b-c1 complex subunit 9 n=1 Tax=Galemys pyrenaicus TaxID=202257 RepID=A0A8J6AKT1_GALPY|nr:Cytochrome b-c1 complex subunit 9 [Galemys pyrenaicus]